MNNNCIQSNTRKGENRLLNIVDQSQLIKPDSMISNHSEMIAQLKVKIEVQQATINTLLSEMNEIKINFQFQSKFKDDELSHLREKCSKFQSRVKELEDNSINKLNIDRLQNSSEKLTKERVSFDGNESDISELNEADKSENKENDYCEEFTEIDENTTTTIADVVLTFFTYFLGFFFILFNRIFSYEGIKKTSGAIDVQQSQIHELAEFDEKLSVATAIDSIGHKTTEANQVQPLRLSKELKENNQDNMNCVSITRTTQIDHEVNLMDSANSTSTKENICNVTNTLTGHNEKLIAVQIQDQIETVDTTRKNPKQKLRENKLEAYFKSDPIGALQELCRSRDWILPKYQFFKEGDSRTFTYSVVCTVLSFTVRVNGVHKKIGKRQVATEMYHKIKNFTSSKVDLAKYVSEINPRGNGIVSDERVFTSAGFYSKPDTTDVVDAPVFTLADETECIKINKDSAFKTCNEVLSHPASLKEHDNGRPIVISKCLNRNENHESSVNESVIVNEDNKSLFASVDADLVERFRLSNNPGLRKLKEIKTIDMLTVPSNVLFLHQIAREEELILDYELFECCSLTIRKDFTGIQLTVNHCALTVVGFGETILESQEDAAYECLSRFKSILE
ncbi:uncharacterized protein LOC112682879 [Sipha flava]|uniref:Uncharacterized protein LOC112682879 n=1 Tax=Sipha flava TaxID=143950 RepID=A0A8B8FFV9_9HEMI|nr:uncharacterized protein LOC112682879 [Sipha flava]